MRLEIAEFPVSEIRLGTKFGYDSGKLEACDTFSGDI